MPRDTGSITRNSTMYARGSKSLWNSYLTWPSHSSLHGCGYMISTTNFGKSCLRRAQHHHHQLSHYTMRHFVDSVILQSISLSPIHGTSMPWVNSTLLHCMLQ